MLHHVELMWNQPIDLTIAGVLIPKAGGVDVDFGALGIDQREELETAPQAIIGGMDLAARTGDLRHRPGTQPSGDPTHTMMGAGAFAHPATMVPATAPTPRVDGQEAKLGG